MEMFMSFAETGRYMALETNLLLRNKRSRQMLLMFPIMIAYLLFMVLKQGSQHQNSFMNMFLLGFLSGLGVVYGQFVFSWESSYFDGIMTRKIDFSKYIKAKYFLMSTLSILGFIPIFIALTLQGNSNFLMMISFLIFSLGVNNVVILYLGSFNDGRIDLSQSQFFNYQGVGGTQYILGLVIMLLPIGTYSLFKYLWGNTGASLILAISGGLLVIFHNLWIKRIIVPQFIRRKYKNLEGFRKLSF